MLLISLVLGFREVFWNLIGAWLPTTAETSGQAQVGLLTRFSVEALWIGYASLVIVLLGAGAWIKEEVWGAWRAEARLRRTQFRRARDYANDFLKQWSEVADSYTLEASDIRTKLDRLKSDYLALQSSFDEEIRRLEQEKEKAQRRDFLDCQYIEKAQISKIGPGRKATLRGFGVETALDIVERLSMIDIPGFGRGLKSELAAWARQVGTKFTFDPRKGIPEAERRLRVAQYRRRQLQMETNIKGLAHRLREITGNTRQRLAELAAPLQEAHKRLAIAKADLSQTRQG